MYYEDVIAAISTPIGEGGIAIIRMSGKGSEEILKKIFRFKRNKKDPIKSHYLYLGEIIDKKKNEVVDEVLISFMKSPKSFTKEDVVEIYAHGGVIVAKKILDLVLKEGARIAEPGEFTKRAFLNGRLDLSQAESIIDIIRAKTEKGLNLAVKQLKGELAEKINIIRESLIEIIANLEAEIDFPEEDIKVMSIHEIKKNLENIAEQIKKMIKEYEKGKIYREGLKVVIAGRPNVGKSTLLNALLREDRAIVTEIPGTTRDAIEEYINVAGIPLNIIDTAGIRETEDRVESLGVERTKRLLKEADLVLLIFDASEGLTSYDKELISLLKESKKRTLIIINKMDIEKIMIEKKEVEKLETGFEIIEISAKEKVGIERVEEKIEEMALGENIDINESITVTKARHKHALIEAEKSLRDTLNAIKNGLSGEFLAIDVRTAIDALGKITGETVEEDILDKIFAEFCIGK